MCNKLTFQRIVSFLIVFVFISCDKEFNEIGANIVGQDHFKFEKFTDASVIAYNQNLGPVASNNLEINPLGIYDNPAFGTTTASFVTQLELLVGNPTFKTINTAPVIDSVILNVPYFSRVKETKTDGSKIYQLDSIYGESLSKLKLSIHESGFYLRDLDPSQQLGAQQLFYTDKNSEINANKIGSRLNDFNDLSENDEFIFSPAELKEKITESSGTVNINRSAPGMRLHLNKTFFTNKILNAPSGKLYNNNVFKNYFRGLYFKIENSGSSAGNMAMLNFKGGKITIYYKEDNSVTTGGTTTVERASKTLVLNLLGNTVSLLENSNQNASYISALNNSNNVIGDEKLYLKGGQGSMAVIDLFGKDLNNNGIADEIEEIKSKKWMINEANLTFYVDKVSMSNTKTIEPQRILLYDIKNKKPLVDYFLDGTNVSANPKLNKASHGGIIEREAVANGRGVKYKIRITNHVRNLVKHDSTNVKLGLSVIESINSQVMSKLKTPVNPSFTTVPMMSVISPLGTVLYGNKAGSSIPEDKKLKLEIYYTKPN